MKICTKCSRANPPSGLFCAGCGNPLPVESPDKAKASPESNALKSVYSSWETDRIVTALTKERWDYRDEAVEALERELAGRNVPLPERCSNCRRFNPAEMERCACGTLMWAPAAPPAPSPNAPPPVAIPAATFRALKANKKIADEIRCGICGSPFVLGEDIVQCERCQAFFHPKCRDEYKGCNSPGCKEEGKACPFCGEKIKIDALKCKHCGEYLDKSLRQSTEVKVEPADAGSAMTMGIIGIFCFGIILGPIAISKANRALAVINAEPGTPGKGKATAGLVLGIIDTVLGILNILLLIARMGAN